MCFYKMLAYSITSYHMISPHIITGSMVEKSDMLFEYILNTCSGFGCLGARTWIPIKRPPLQRTMFIPMNADLYI